MRMSDVWSGGFGLAPSPPVGQSFYAKIRLHNILFLPEKAGLEIEESWMMNRFALCLCEVQRRSTEIVHLSLRYRLYHDDRWQILSGRFTLEQDIISDNRQFKLWITSNDMLITTVINYQSHKCLQWKNARMYIIVWVLVAQLRENLPCHQLFELKQFIDTSLIEQSPNFWWFQRLKCEDSHFKNLSWISFG